MCIRVLYDKTFGWGGARYSKMFVTIQPSRVGNPVILKESSSWVPWRLFQSDRRQIGRLPALAVQVAGIFNRHFQSAYMVESRFVL